MIIADEMNSKVQNLIFRHLHKKSLTNKKCNLLVNKLLNAFHHRTQVASKVVFSVANKKDELCKKKQTYKKITVCNDGFRTSKLKTNKNKNKFNKSSLGISPLSNHRREFMMILTFSFELSLNSRIKSNKNSSFPR